jgi:hypothetical protein
MLLDVPAGDDGQVLAPIACDLNILADHGGMYEAYFIAYNRAWADITTEDDAQAAAEIKDTTVSAISQEAKDEYIGKRSSCPFCAAVDCYLEPHPLAAVGGRLERLVQCGDCEQKWTEVYTLTDIETEEAPIEVPAKLIKAAQRALKWMPNREMHMSRYKDTHTLAGALQQYASHE